MTVATQALAQTQAAEGTAGTGTAPPISLELNKLEPNGKGCRAYIVAANAGADAYPTLKLDVILFRADGVIDRRIALDLGPLPASKRHVKTFDLDSPPCEGIGSVLINDVLDCRIGTEPSSDCLDRLAVSSRASATLTK